MQMNHTAGSPKRSGSEDTNMDDSGVNPPQRPLRPTRLLIVDEDEALRTELAALLTDAGFEVLQAANGRAAIDAQERGAAEVVIAEMLLPEVDGFELIAHFSRQVGRPKFIAMTSGGKLGADFYLKTARQLGAHGVLAKPFENKKLLEMIMGVLRGGTSTGPAR